MKTNTERKKQSQQRGHQHNNINIKKETAKTQNKQIQKEADRVVVKRNTELWGEW